MAVLKVDTNHNPLYQSGYTYLQAAGSDGTDQTVAGRHLKWDFLRSLGDNHLPKGDHSLETPYQTSAGFNRADDFVHIYRATFREKTCYVELQMGTTPENIVQVNGKWNWTYELPLEGSRTADTSVRLIFTNTNAYDLLYAAMGPSINFALFINSYPGVIELHADDKLAFYYEFDATFPNKKPGEPYIRVEAVGVPDSLDRPVKQLNVRQTYTMASTDLHFLSENTEFIRFEGYDANIRSVFLITYEDYILGMNASSEGWTNMGAFALMTSETDMKANFMEDYIDGTYGHWPRFNDVTGSEFTVNKQNYFNRWRRNPYTFNKDNESNNDPLGLQTFVHTYMKQSVSDLKATVALPSDDAEDETEQVISYLDMLRLVSLDFHVSRMLGMGCIDREEYPYQYIYCLQYYTEIGLEAPLTPTIPRTHLYMTLPTGTNDYRLPKAPQLEELTYGVEIDNGTGEPASLTDAAGYAPQENLRFINVNRAPFDHENPLGTFFYESTPVMLANESQPVAYGLEYKEVSELAYRKPELNNDPDYLDHAGIPETVPILENGGPRMFTHQEEEEGTHVYAAYAINWFSRISPLSNTKQATTLFPKITRMLPPFNYSTQLIQDEDPAEDVISAKSLMLTTEAEQQLLLDIASADKTLVRTTFDWNQVHNNAHPTVDYAEFFFREDEPMVVTGKITGVTMIDAETALVATGPYQVTSAFPAETVQPVIGSGDATKFTGSLLSTGQSHYAIEAVGTTGSNPQLRIKVLKQNQAVAPDTGNQNQFLSLESIELPQPGDLFFAVENTGDPANWDLRHTSRIYIEKHYNNASVGLRYSPTLVVPYGIKGTSVSGLNLRIALHEKLKSGSTPTVEYTVRRAIVQKGASQFRLYGNSAPDLTNGKTFRVFGNGVNDKIYTVSGNATFNLSQVATIVNVVESIPDTTIAGGVADFVVNRAGSVDLVNNRVTINNTYNEELRPAIVEYVTETDGSQTRFVVGGINTSFTFEPLLDGQGNGTGFIQLLTPSDLEAHPDRRVAWYKGTIRLTDVSGKKQVYPVSYIGNLTASASGTMAVVIQDPGFIPANPEDVSPADVYTLDLNTPQTGNFHPSYRFYLAESAGLHPTTGAVIPGGGVHFREPFILPETGNPLSGSKKTMMSVRALDFKNNLYSYLSAPAALLAQKISIPVAPGLPQGPLYATRPNFFGKSTYTFDTKVNTDNDRFPYAMIFYRASSDKILDVLYSADTQLAIRLAWSGLPESFAQDPQLWNILFNGETDTDPSEAGNFREHTTTEGSFRWPRPDNGTFFLPFESHLPLSETNPAGGLSKPFFLEPFSLAGNYTVYGTPISRVNILKLAIADAFIAMNEQPPVAAYIKPGRQTSPTESVLRDTNGNLLDPQANDLYPMVKTFTDEGDTYMRFTDYHLDGASTSLYFYRAMEMDDKYKFSGPSATLGPVVLVNSFAPDKPQIRKALTQLQDQLLPPGIVLELNPYRDSEQITQLEIYRAIDPIDALSVRTMDKVKTISWGDPVMDDFSDVTFPLYGEDLHYRVVAVRIVKDVHDVLDQNSVSEVAVPSYPSDVVRTTLVDTNNPEAPELTFVIGDTTAEAYEDVQIIWSATCYNGTYYLQQLNSSGNWVEVYRVSQAEGVMTYTLPDDLPLEDEDGDPIYHRFRVEVENSSGLFNLEHKEYIVQQILLAQEDYGAIDLEDNSGSLIL